MTIVFYGRPAPHIQAEMNRRNGEAMVERFRAAGLTPMDGKWEARPCKVWFSPPAALKELNRQTWIIHPEPARMHGEFDAYGYFAPALPRTIATTGWERHGDTLHEIETTRTYDEDGKQVGFVARPTGQTKEMT